ncbi:hypothetical protein, partial [Cellulomonas iranensis]|uniref:hypothetical protein n=1 Tax=Cellulomonas iranensis TaxID=76862 RepID=UPI001C4EED72
MWRTAVRIEWERPFTTFEPGISFERLDLSPHAGALARKLDTDQRFRPPNQAKRGAIHDISGDFPQ